MKMITSNGNSIDRISSLPDPLLCHILSFLTTKKAAATSVLSKQWRYLWILVPDIHVNHSQIRKGGRYTFERVISNILLRKAPSNIRKIRLQFVNSHSIREFFNTLFSRAPARNVEELDLYCKEDGYPSHLPPNLFSSKTLVILKLTHNIFVDYVSSVQLPSLKVLHLSYVLYKGDESVRNLISGCPILDELLVERSRYDNVIHYDICSRTLTNVCVAFWDFDFCWNNWETFTTLNAPALKYLTLIKPLSSNFEISDVHNLVEANLDVGYAYESSRWGKLMDIFRLINNVKFLRLEGVFKAQRDTHDHQYYIAFMESLPEFHNVVKLKLLSEAYCIWCLFKRLLPKFPHLEHLTILRVHMCYKCRCGMPHYPIPLEFVPTCLSSHLKTFILQKFEGFKLEMGFIRCILENSRALMDMTINYPPAYSKKSFHIWKRLSSFERGSPKCQLTFEKGKYS